MTWYNEITSEVATNSENWLQLSFEIECARKEVPVYNCMTNGSLSHKKSKELLNFFEEKKLLQIKFEEHSYLSKESSDFYEFVSPAEYCSLYYCKHNKEYSLSFHSSNKQTCNELYLFLKRFGKRKPTVSNGKVFILTQSKNGLKLTSLGMASVPLKFENYTKSIHEQINRVIKDFNNSCPDGRISIFEGPPGTGKTFLIRGIVNEIKNATFIFIPPGMVSSLSDPSLIGSLISLRNGTSNRPTSIDDDFYDHSPQSSQNKYPPVVLIIEDADSVLTQRAADNMAGISSMLNITAGLIGELIDIRVIATTNATKTDIEPAILRPGRLSQYIKVSSLSIEEANELFKKLTKSEELPNWNEVALHREGKEARVGFGGNQGNIKSITLAEVYHAAKLAKEKIK